jgi:putative spermidine/putrescine transport system substrate-binding protein
MNPRVRRIISGAFAVCLAASMTACSAAGPGGGAERDLTLVTWGGTTADGFKSVYADPFTKETGIPTKMVSPVDYGKYTAQLQSGNVTWDWVDIEGWYSLQHKDDWAKIDRNVVNYDDADVISLPGKTAGGIDWGIPSPSYSFAIAYRTDQTAHPKTWAEFFNPAAIPGKRAIYNSPYGMLEVALLADGVPMDKLYPLDVDRALRKLDSVRSDLVFWNSGAELQQILTSGSAPFAYAWNNRVAALMKDKQPVAIEWNQNLQDGGQYSVAKSSPMVEQTMKLFNFMMDPGRQAQIAESTGYSPVLKSAFKDIPAQDQPQFNVFPANLDSAVGAINQQWWAENYEMANKKWTEWASQ